MDNTAEAAGGGGGGGGGGGAPAPGHKSAEDMDRERERSVAYQYLCHLTEARGWLEAVLAGLGTETRAAAALPPPALMEEALRTGVHLALLGHRLAPARLPLTKIYDMDHHRYNISGLQFRHTENIHNFLKVLQMTELPKTFYPETTDIYDKKNMPKLIYCIHALSTHLFKLGKAPLMQDLYGKAEFTEIEIDNMSKELKKYGIMMPSFQKIGGLLTTNVKGDIASLHAAIININDAIDGEKPILQTLLDENANLSRIVPKFDNDYHRFLKSAKETKVQNSLNRSLDDSYVPDAYDELLTQAEIQGHINLVNFSRTWKNIIEAVSSGNKQILLAELNTEWLNIDNVKSENVWLYLQEIEKLDPSSHKIRVENVVKWNTELKNLIKECNEKANQQTMLLKTIDTINKSLDSNDINSLSTALSRFGKHTNLYVDNYSLPLIFEELKMDKNDCGVLTEEDLKNSITVLTAIANISKQIDIGSNDKIVEALHKSSLPFEDFRKEISDSYCAAFKCARHSKVLADLPCSLLTFTNIQECIDSVNDQEDSAQNLISVLQKLNDAIRNDDCDLMMNILHDERLNFRHHLISGSDDLYLKLLKIALKKNHNRDLWFEDLQKIIMDVDSETKEIEDVTNILAQINLALLNSNAKTLKENLSLLNHNVKKVDANVVFNIFIKHFENKNVYNTSPWIVHHTNAGKTVYINVETFKPSWITPKDFKPSSKYLSMKDVHMLLDKITKAAYDPKKIILLQAYIRGYILRKKLRERFEYLENNIDKIIKLQTWWKMMFAKKRYKKIIRNRLEHSKINQQKINDPQAYYKSKEHLITRIQALWRGKCARKAFTSLIHEKNPPFKVVKHFVPILDFSTEDYEREIELQSYRSEAVQTIRKNLELSKQLEDMDLKIGLLIQNRISLEDVVAHRTKLNDLVKRSNVTEGEHEKDNVPAKTPLSSSARGLKLLNKESRHLLEGYQHLFYQLQTDPKYLSKLLFCLPQSRSNLFLQNVIFSLYNFGANMRDEYLLLKLFRFSLEEEINCKFGKPMDIITGNPVVLKMVVNHARTMDDLQCLRKIVGPLVEKVLNDKHINIDTSPIDIYKTFRNQQEMKTGQPSSYPMSVDQEQALKFEEVRSRLNKSLKTLISMVQLFLDRITSCTDMLPFSIRYMARVLNFAILNKFPHTPEKDILKIIGHLVYYQFINAAIVAPDAFEIVTSSHKNPLTNDQRRNLASIAKILQFSASKKGFGEEAKHLQCLNPFIIECHEKMKNFFRQCCQGPTLEEYFSMDEYSEAVMINKPHIYISIEEIYNTHNLLLEYEEIIAPEASDPLHELLDAVSSPNSGDLIPLATLSPMTNAEIGLSLTNKYELVADDMSDINKLFLKTKELCILILPFLNGEHLLQALCIGTTKAQEEQYRAFVEQRLYSGTIKPNEYTSLREQITLLRKYLNKLDDEGYVSREDGYQSIITAIASDLCSKGKCRKEQAKALKRIKKSKHDLDQKTEFYEEQCKYYNEYINKCLENLSTGKRIHSVMKNGKSQRKVKSKLSFKTTGSKLYDKGVLLEVQDLTVSQLKNVQFEFTPSEHNGVFIVKARFLGVELEKIEIDVQKLLQYQYEGCTIINLFDKAKINVNLLLFLLNTKFYGKS